MKTSTYSQRREKVLASRDMKAEKPFQETITQAITDLFRYCQDNDWAGYDPSPVKVAKALIYQHM